MNHTTLAGMIAEAAVLHGNFTLRSGRKSNYYIDKYLFLSRPEILVALAPMLAAKVPPGTTRLAGAELGGIPLVTIAAIETGLPCVFVRNARKQYGTAKQLEGHIEPGDRVAFIEDVATTAGQALEAVGTLEAAGATITGVVTVVDREEGARANVEKAGHRFDALFTKSDLGIGGTAPGTSSRSTPTS